MLKEMFNFLVDNKDKVNLVYNYTEDKEKNVFIYEVLNSNEVIMIVTDKHTRPLNIDISKIDAKNIDSITDIFTKMKENL